MSQATYHDLYVVSDLHLGGKPGVQIFQAGLELAAFLEHLIALPLPGGQAQGLTINGDTVDFLAEEPAACFALTDASAKLRRIMDDPAFVPVWDGLAKFVATPGRELTIVLGNHDIELVLPDVKALLIERLTENDPTKRARLRLCFDGTGFGCAVGSRQVLCLHGNESDPFNVVDFEQLRKLNRTLNRGRAPGEKDLPRLPGSRVVVEVMNEIKSTYRWLDLLKPEGAAVFPILLALRPQYLKKLIELGDEGLEYLDNQRKIDAGFLGPPAHEGAEGARRPRGADLLCAQLAEAFGEPVARLDEESLLTGLAERLERGQTTNPREAQPEGQLGASDWLEGTYKRIRDYLKTKSAPHLLRLALKRFLEHDATFEVTKKDKTFLATEEAIGAGVRFVVTGHTHLQRAIPRAAGGAYFNSGTWVQLMQLEPTCLQSEAAFRPVYEGLKRGGWPDIARLMCRKPGVVRIWNDPAHGATGQLCNWQEGALVPVSQSLS